MFGPPRQYFSLSLAPRRHHCRMCGLLFCGEHSKQRIPLLQPISSGAITNQRKVKRERVCDVCISPSELSTSPISQPGSRRQSILSSSQASHDSGTSRSSDQLYTPVSEISSSPFTRRSRSRSRMGLQVEVDENPQLAPLEPWMGPGGELSLYPLAINPSNSKVTNTHRPAVPPLYAPSLVARRQRMRENQAKDASWVFDKWGYKREDFDPDFDSEEEIEQRGTKGGLVRDGDICFRVRGREAIAPERRGRSGISGLDQVYLKRCGSSVERISRAVSTF
jgi:hypothetical protein